MIIIKSFLLQTEAALDKFEFKIGNFENRIPDIALKKIN